MKNPIAISILIVGILFTAMYGWLNLYEYKEFSSGDHQIIVRINQFTLDRCMMWPPMKLLDLMPSSSEEIFMKRDKEFPPNWCKE